MHWTNSSCIKWASRPLCFIFFGSSFWYLKVRWGRERIRLGSLIKRRFYVKISHFRIVNLERTESLLASRTPMQRGHRRRAYSHNRLKWNSISIPSCWCASTERRKNFFAKFSIYLFAFHGFSERNPTEVVARAVHAMRPSRFPQHPMHEITQNITTKFSLSVCRILYATSIRTIHRAWWVLPAFSFLPPSVWAPAGTALAHSRIGERYRGEKMMPSLFHVGRPFSKWLVIGRMRTIDTQWAG